MDKRIHKGIYKWLGSTFIRPDLGVVMSLIIAFVGMVFGSGWNVTNWILFIVSGIGISIIIFAIFQAVGRLFLWAEKQIDPYSITHKSDQDTCDLLIKNDVDTDITDFRIELKRLTTIGYRTDCQVDNEKPFFTTGIKFENNTIKSGDTATIKIANTFEFNGVYPLSFLIDGEWKSPFVYGDITNDNDDVKERMGKWGGVLYEFLLEVTGKLDSEYIKPQIYRGVISYFVIYHGDDLKNSEPASISWVRIDKLSNEEKKRELQRGKFREDNEVINSNEDFWTFYEQIEKGQRHKK